MSDRLRRETWTTFLSRTRRERKQRAASRPPLRPRANRRRQQERNRRWRATRARRETPRRRPLLALQRARTASIAKGATRPTSTRPPQNGREHAPFNTEATDVNAAASVGVAPEEAEPPCSSHAAPSHSATTTASRARRTISARTTCRIVRPKTVAIPENTATMLTSATPLERAEIANSPAATGEPQRTDGIPDSNSPV